LGTFKIGISIFFFLDMGDPPTIKDSFLF